MDLWQSTFDSLSCLDSTFAGHFHIHYDDVRSESKSQLNGFVPIGGLTNDG